MINVTEPVHVPCKCTGCGGEHHQQGECQEFANGRDAKMCKKCEAQLDAVAVAVAPPGDAERNP
jgi:hypothetical protein